MLASGSTAASPPNGKVPENWYPGYYDGYMVFLIQDQAKQRFDLFREQEIEERALI